MSSAKYAGFDACPLPCDTDYGSRPWETDLFSGCWDPAKSDGYGSSLFKFSTGDGVIIEAAVLKVVPPRMEARAWTDGIGGLC